MIPKILHYVWVGPNEIPSNQAAWIWGWRQLMPDWELRHWGNRDIDWSVPFLRQAASVHAWNRISDYLRMHALSTVGGIYLDTDIQLVRPLDPLIGDGEHAFLGAEETDPDSPNLFAVGVLGSPAQHWLPCAAKARLMSLDARDELDCYTGPGLITDLLREHGANGYPHEPTEVSDVRMYPVDYFYPYRFREEFDERCITHRTYAIHHWAHSWNPAGASLKRRIERRSRQVSARLAPKHSVARVRKLLDT